MKFTIDCLREILDELDAPSLKKSNGSLEISLGPTLKFYAPLSANFVVDERAILGRASSPEYALDAARDKKLEFCSWWNQTRVVPKVYLDDSQNFIAEIALPNSPELSKERVKIYGVALFFATVDDLFAEIQKRFGYPFTEVEPGLFVQNLGSDGTGPDETGERESDYLPEEDEDETASEDGEGGFDEAIRALELELKSPDLTKESANSIKETIKLLRSVS
ncbi:MAG: hypothetical protein IJM30_02610 [Thermoguttaceae bacterium]|nr:hypothetical protein [Thermoguttaceae bacterium]